jgi:branched-chain amino acid transport system substrate-binding protein
MKKPTISIGVGAPLSGLAASLGRELKQAIELAAQEKNSRGGIGGHEIRVLTYDDESRPAKAEAVARQLAQVEDIAGVIGHYGSDTSIAAASIYAAAELCLLAPVASNPRLTESGLTNIFRYTNRDDRTAAAMAGHLFRQLNKRKAMIVKTDTAYGNSMSGEFEKAFRNCGGAVTDFLAVPEGVKDLTELVRRFPRDFDVLFYGGTFEGASLLKAVRSAGLPQLMATGDGCWDNENFLLPAQDVVEKDEGVLVLSASNAVGDIEGSERFAAAYKGRYGDLVNYALNSYDCAGILLQAIEAAVASGNKAIPDRKVVREAVKAIRFKGLANGNWTRWDAKGDNMGAVTRLYRVRNGRFDAAEPVTPPAPYVHDNSNGQLRSQP